MEEETMNSIVSLIFSIIVPIVISIITAYFSTKIAYNKEVQKRIYDEREKTYIELFELVEKLKKNSYLVFNSTDFLIPFGELNARLKLYASQNVINVVSPLYDKIYNTSEKYFDLFDSAEGQRIKENFIEHENATEYELQNNEELYMENNVIDSEYVKKVLNDLIYQIRKELKTK